MASTKQSPAIGGGINVDLGLYYIFVILSAFIYISYSLPLKLLFFLFENSVFKVSINEFEPV